MAAQDFEQVFKRLKSILEPYAPGLIVTKDTPDGYSLDTPYVQSNKTRLYFGGVRITKRYVSFHLMPVYVHPELLADISPQLRRRMQGKSCFNFTAVDEALFADLVELTAAAHGSYGTEGYLAT